MDAYLLVGSYELSGDGGLWFDKATQHEILVYYKTRATPWAGAWPPLLPCLRLDFLTRSLWQPYLEKGYSLKETYHACKGEMHGVWL